MANAKRKTTCAIVGGGPAGVMLGFLLARAGVDVTVMEKHADFFRDFRGDTIHASTLEVMHELGLLDAFLKLPHQEAHRFDLHLGTTRLSADFSHLPTRCKYIALMPQWDFLNFLAEHGRRYPGFRLLMGTEVTDLIEEDGRVVGVRATGADGEIEVRADLVAGTDGRHSIVRERAGLSVENLGAPMDVLWMRLPREANEGDEPALIAKAGRILVLINRGDYWQCAYLIAKGGYDALVAEGLPAFRARLAAIAPFAADRTGGLTSWDQIKLLTVRVDRLEQWSRPGLLCIGDAAHAMSPIGGVGVNLAVQDAVAAANRLAAPLAAGKVSAADLAAVQKRRQFPARLTQRLQILAQDNIIRKALAEGDDFQPPLPVRMGSDFSFVQRRMGRLVGIGVRPEHVETPEAPIAALPAK